MKKNQKQRLLQHLFYQLIQVSVGTLDCLDRGPSTEEWYGLYRLSQEQGLVTTCYDGVVRLFDFGLRAPQDLSIDWMAETEDADDSQQDTHLVISNPLRRMLYLRWQQRNGSSLFVRKGQKQMVPAGALITTLLQAFEDFHQNRLKLSAVVHVYRLLHAANGQFSLFRDGSSVQKMLQTLGIWRFSQAMMWTVGSVTALNESKMACKSDAHGGRFLLEEIISNNRTLSQRIKNRLYKLLKF